MNLDAVRREGDAPARKPMTAAARRQIDRKRSWTQMTGFSGEGPNVGEVRTAQEAAPA